MQPLILFLASFPLSLSFALPQPIPDNYPHHSNSKDCISQDAAEKFIERYIGFFSRSGSDLGDAKLTGEKLISDHNFSQHSNSIFSVQGRTISGNEQDDGNELSREKCAFIERVLSVPELPPQGIHTLAALAACDSEGQSKVIWHWQFDSVGHQQHDGGENFPVRGFTMFGVVHSGEEEKNKGHWQAERIDIEFDSVAWVKDEGGRVEVQRRE